MPMRPLSHEARQRQSRARREALRVRRKADDADYAVTRKLLHGQDPRGTGRWQRLRLVILARAPLCADPYGQHGERLVAATEVDHIRGVWDAPEAVFEEANLQGLCHSCHARKSAEERRSKVARGK